MEKENLGRRITDILTSDKRYIVPLYQREYAWEEAEIQQLIEDIYENYTINSEGSYFIGSLVVIGRGENQYEVIDGQQRLTTLSLLAKYIKPETFNKCLLAYDSRVEVTKFLTCYYDEYKVETGIDGFLSDKKELFDNTHLLDNLKNALTIIDDCVLQKELETDSSESIRFSELIKNEKFVDYFFNHVVVIWSEMPEDTNVADYFEIMNNSGEQLQKHEILKSLLMSKLVGKEKEMAVFSRIWDACAFMDDHVERYFKKAERDILFGEYVNEFNPNRILDLSEVIEDNQNEDGQHGIDEILSNPKYAIAEENKRKNEKEHRSESIIDFSNFLMHVFRLLYNDFYKVEDEEIDIPLNEKELIKVYKAIKDNIDAIDFIQKLLYYRVLFDRYVVRISSEDDQDDKWTLKRPQVYEDKQDNKLKKVNYEKNTFEDRNNDGAVKAISMLQVSFPQRKYKNFLNKILSWFNVDSYTIDITYSDYITKLNNLIYNAYISFKNESEAKGLNMMCAGTQTPRFILNYIDYLYYLEGSEPFSFKYYNSVEHHMPQSSEKIEKLSREIIDNIGNLYLISKSENSSLNDHNELRKIEQALANNTEIAPKRKRMYTITQREGKWNKELIEQHATDVLRIIDKSKELLTNQQMDLYNPDVCKALLCIKDFAINTSGNKYQMMPYYEDNQDIEEAKKKLMNWLMTNKGKTAADFVKEQLDDPDSSVNQIDEYWSDWRKAFVKYGCYELIVRQNRSGIVNFADDGNVTILWNNRLGTERNINLKMYMFVEKLQEQKIRFGLFDKNTVIGISMDNKLNFSDKNELCLWIYLNEKNQDWEYVFEAERKLGIPEGFEKVERPDEFTDDQRIYNFYRKIGKDKLVIDKSYSYIKSCEMAFSEMMNML